MNPQFIEPKDIVAGMKLKPWYHTEYEPTDGEYAQCDGYITIRRVDDDFIYYSIDDYSQVNIVTHEYFDTYTLLDDETNPPRE